MRLHPPSLRHPTMPRLSPRRRTYRWAALALAQLTAMLVWAGAAAASCNLLLKGGSTGPANGQFFGASGVAVDSGGNVYVADQNNFRIQKFTSAGVFITKWGSNGTADGQFKGPQGVAVDASDNIYVADTGNDRIQKFDTNGTFLAKFGTSGT